MSNRQTIATSLERPLGTRLTRRTAIKGGAALGLSATALAGGRMRDARAQEKVTIRLSSWVGAEEGQELQAVLDKINAEATTFEIVSEPTPADYYTRLQTTLAGGTGADLFWLSQEWIPSFADRGGLLDLTDRLAAAEAPAAQLDDYFEPILGTAQFDDKTWGLPWISQPVILYYNPDLFAAAEIPEPDESWTWETFTDAATKLTDSANGVYGTAFNQGWPPIQMFIWQAGGEVITEDLSSCPIDSPEAIAGADFYASVIYKEALAPSEAMLKEQGFAEMAKAGKVAMFFGGSGDDLDFAHLKDPANAVMKAALVPKGPQNRTTFAWTASTVINADTENPDAAFEALVALTEGIHHWKVVAPRKSLANEETIVASLPDKAASAPVIVQALPDMRSFHVIPEHQEWDTIFWEEFQLPLFAGEASAEDLAAEVRPLLEDLLP